MDEEEKIKKVLTWAGLLVLVALPIALLLKKRKNHVPDEVGREDDSDGTPSELYG